MKKILSLILMLFPLFVYSQVRIEMEKDAGVYKVPCEVNGARMKMVFDTGASYVSLSQTMYNYLKDNDYISATDSKGYADFKDATGKITSCKLVNLHTIEIAGKQIHDIIASVSPSQSAPLLLGLTAIQKFGKVTVEGNTLVIGTEEAEGDVVPTSVLGCKFGDSKSNISYYLKRKYGDQFYTLDYETLCVYDIYLNGIELDAMFVFDSNDKLMCVRLSKIYNKNEMSLAIKNRDQLANYYRNKYSDVEEYTNDYKIKFYECGGTYQLNGVYYSSIVISINTFSRKDKNTLLIDYFWDKYLNKTDDI